MSNLLLDRILNDPGVLSARFQPIFQLGSEVNQIDSLEGLIRGPKGTLFEAADVLFDYVRRKRAEAAVDRSCIIAICRAVAELPGDFRINLNVHASTLGHNAGFVEFFRQQARNMSLALDRFTLEIVEHSPSHNVPDLISSLGTLRDLGVRIALDDIGLGNSNYRMILDCHPDYFKLDAYFVQGVSYDPDRRAVVKSVMCLAEEMKGVVVAEGGQSLEDFSTLTQMGVKLFQANLLCPAVPAEELLAKGLLETKTGVAAHTPSQKPSPRSQHEAIPSAMRQPACHDQLPRLVRA
jgi:EAL domain-containing protein (putative c-di-GMP-specific phosphodiesterase class I)